MNKSKLILWIAKEQDLSSDIAAVVVAMVFDNIAARLANGGRVELRGFGTFSTRGREARDARNPRTGDPVAIVAKRVPHFKPGKAMQKRVDTIEA